MAFESAYEIICGISVLMAEKNLEVLEIPGSRNLQIPVRRICVLQTTQAPTMHDLPSFNVGLLFRLIARYDVSCQRVQSF